MTTLHTPRERAKAERTDALLHAAARLFAERGFSGVSIEDIGAVVGVSGPAVYRHFAGKQQLLGAILVSVSRSLFDGGAEVFAGAAAGNNRMQRLIDFHIEFSLGNPDVIRVHDRELVHLSEEDRAEVRRLQRAYVDLWIQALKALLPEAHAEELRLRVQAAFGLMNSTPHSTRSATRRAHDTAFVLRAMAAASLIAPTS